MLRLRTLGGLWIEGYPAPAPPGPRRLGLLAIVAAAGRRGVSRDRVLGILWAETAEDNARHTLAQNLYALRRHFDRDVIAAAGPVLRLGADVTGDVVELHDALEAGDDAGAVALYTGDFLEGFYLPGVPEFERWVEEERSRLRAAVVRAYERLAQRADAEGAVEESIRMWRHLCELDPVSARYAAGAMRALAAVGDRPAALAHARTYEERVRRELESEPDPSIRRLVAALRASEPESAVAGIPPAVRQQSAGKPAPATGIVVPSGAPTGVRSRSWLRIGAAAVVLFLGGAGAIRALLGGAAEVPPLLAVGAIRVVGRQDTADVGPVLRDMLATRLGTVPGLRVVANSRLVELTASGAVDAADLTEAARRVGAAAIVEGEVAYAGSGLTLSLRSVSLADGVVRMGLTIHAADRFALADSAAAAIARGFALPAPPGTGPPAGTQSVQAYALYEEGLRAHFAGRAAAAMRLMQAALGYDSTFAMAAYYAWQTSRAFIPIPETEPLRQRARRLAPRAAERERLLIEGSVSELDAPYATMLAIAETLSVRYPDDTDGQLLLGNARAVAGDWAGAVAAYDRVVALDSAAGLASGSLCRMCTALVLAATQYLWWDSAQAAERAARRLIALRPDEPNGWGGLVEPLLRQGRRAEAEVAARQVDVMSRSAGSAQFYLHRDLLRAGRYDDLERELAPAMRSPSPETHSQARWLWLFALRDQGRLREAEDFALTGVIPGTTTRLPDAVPLAQQLAIIALEDGRPRDAAARFREIAARARVSVEPVGAEARVIAWNLTLAGTALATADDTLAVRALADSVERLGRTSNFGRDPRLHHFLRGLLLQKQARHADAVAAFQRSLFSTTDGYTRTNLALAHSLLALGRAAEAIAILQPALRGGIDGSNTYTTRTELHEALAGAFAAAGAADSAAAHYRIVERTLRNGDPRFRARYEHARDAASRHARRN